MTLTLHHCHDARSFRSLWLLYELGVPFDLKLHDFGKALRDPAFLALSPAGRVPALEHDGVVLCESGAIAEYLCEVFRSPLYRAPGDPERAAWLQWLHYAETMGQSLANLTQQHIVIRDDADRSPLLMKLERRRLEKMLEGLDAHLGAREMMLESGFSAVDISIGYSVDVARRFTPLEAAANVARYHGALSARPAFQKALPPPDALRIYKDAFYDLPEIAGA